MSERLEDRLRDALDLLAEQAPLRRPNAPRAAGASTPPRRTGRRFPMLLALAALVVVGLVMAATLGRTPDDALRQVTGPTPADRTIAAVPAPPAPATPRPAHPDLPTVRAAPLARAMLAFGYGDDGHWSWFVVDGVDRSIRVAADLPVGGRYGNGGGALSPDGRRLAYSLLPDPTPGAVAVTAQVVVVDLGDGHETRFEADALIGPRAWSPDGGRLAWVDRRAHRLVVATSDGRPTASVGVADGRITVAWSPDGGRILVAGCPDQPDIVVDACPPSVVDAASLAVRDLPQPVTARVAWTPDGKEIVDGAARGMVLVAADGSGRRNLDLAGSPYPMEHLFSPDGTRMLVRPDSSGLRLPYIGVYGLGDGRLRTELSDPQQVPFVQGWKGDDALLVAREEPGAFVLYSVPLDGSARQRLVSIAIRSEDFSTNWLVADWFSRG